MSSTPLRILLTNRELATRAGTELYTADLALGLLARGHLPVVYSPVHGEVAAMLRRRSVPVTDSLTDIDTIPDLIHAHHRVTAMTALARYPGVPAVYVAHDFTHPDDVAPRHPRIRRYLAVDDTNRDRLLFVDGIPESLVDVHLNWCDVERFVPRAEPLPATPRRAVVFSNQTGTGGFLPVLREACAMRGITLDVIGLGGVATDAPESLLGGYDVVFAKARAALEAMTSGCATILCDYAGFGGLVTATNVVGLRRLNFGLRSLSSAHDVGAVLKALDAYDPQDAAAVSQFIRRDADMDLAIDRLIELYRETIAEPRWSDDGEARDTAGFLESTGRQIHELRYSVTALEAAVRTRDDQLLSAAARASQQDALLSDCSADRTQMAAELHHLSHEHRVLSESTTFKVRRTLAANPVLLTAWKRINRRR